MAEDNPINQEVIAASLTRLGHAFIIVENGAAALDALANDSFDMVLMDCRMPVMDGFEATRSIREREAGTGTHIPIIAISANAMQGDRELCLASGMDDHIAKPFALADLSRTFAIWAHSELPEPPAALQRTAAARPQSGTYTLLDVDMLRSFDDLQIAGEPSIIGRLIDSFLESAPEQLSEIENGLASGNLKNVAVAAHGMKSASQQIGLPRLSEQFEDIEALSIAENARDARKSFESLKSTLARCQKELVAFKMDIAAT